MFDVTKDGSLKNKLLFLKYKKYIYLSEKTALLNLTKYLTWDNNYICQFNLVINEGISSLNMSP